MNPIEVGTEVRRDPKSTWDLYTGPEHIMQWNFASPDWCCPVVENELVAGGRYFTRMEARDGSAGFDFQGTYSEVIPLKSIRYTLEDERNVMVSFEALEGRTRVTIVFDPDLEHPISMQRDGWQAILDNFRKYAETKCV